MKKLFVAITILSCTHAYAMLASLLGGQQKTQAQQLAKAPAPAPTAQQNQPIVAQQAAKQPATPQTTIYNQQSPVIVNVNNNLTQNDNKAVSNNNNLEQNQHAEQHTFQYTYQHAMQQVSTIVAQLRDRLHEQYTSLLDWARTNKYKLGLAGVGASYAGISGYLMHAHYRMQDEALWAQWRIEDSYERLVTMNQKALSDDLVFAIQRRYTSSARFTDFIQPLTQFMQDLEQEKKFLRRYLMAAKWIGYTRTQWLFPINAKKIKRAKKLLKRVYFIEHVFLSWAATFKIAQNET